MSLLSPCPRCQTVVSYAAGAQPTCPTCGFPGADARFGPPTPSPAWTPAVGAGWTGPSPTTVQPARTSGKAIASMVLGICGIIIYPLSFVLGLIALILGVVARKEIRASNGALGGSGMAVTGIVLGIIGAVVVGIIVLSAVVFVLVSDLGGAPSVVPAVLGA